MKRQAVAIMKLRAMKSDLHDLSGQPASSSARCHDR
jgi:hypothetical protein